MMHLAVETRKPSRVRMSRRYRWREAHQVRQWAANVGIECPPTGSIPHELREVWVTVNPPAYPVAVIVDRSTMWGNRFRVVPHGLGWAVVNTSKVWGYFTSKLEAQGEAVRLFHHALFNGDTDEQRNLLGFTRDEARMTLGGKDLACWCAETHPCHVDPLINASN